MRNIGWRARVLAYARFACRLWIRHVLAASCPACEVGDVPIALMRLRFALLALASPNEDWPL